MAELIRKEDTLNEGRVKLNAAIEDAETAKGLSEQADDKATQALANSESTQTQLDTIVIDGDSSVEAAQARVSAEGTTYGTLKQRLDSEHASVTSQLAQKVGKNKGMISITDPPYNAKDGEDVTDKLQQAINDYPEGSILIPLAECTLGLIKIPHNINIVAYNTEVHAKDSCLFTPSTDLDFITIEGFKNVYFTVDSNNEHGKHFFMNAQINGQLGVELKTFITDISHIPFNVKQIIIKNCNIGSSRISVVGDSGVFIDNVTWDSDGTSIAKPTYLQISQWGLTSKKRAIIERSLIDVVPSSLNDLIKISGESSDVIIKDNVFISKDPAIAGEIDIYSGGEKLIFENNSLVNVQYHRKQTGAEGPVTQKLSFDTVKNNVFEITDGYSHNSMLYIRGSLFSIQGNRFINRNGINKTDVIHLDREQEVYDDFNTMGAAAFIIQGNIADVRDGRECIFINYNKADGLVGGASVVGNILIGGVRFITTDVPNSTITGNVWLESNNSEGHSINTSPSGSAVGNVVDTDVPQLPHQMLNNVDIVLPSVDSTIETEPDVKGKTILQLTGNGTITNLQNGRIGQQITLFGWSGGCTIQNNGNFYLAGNTDLKLESRESVTLVMFKRGEWYEIARKKNT